MKVIDLLNKIANGEIPKKIKKNNTIYVIEESDYFSNMYIDENNTSKRLLLDFIPDLNKEVEIIEEDKKIEKIVFNEQDDFIDVPSTVELANKINEIIDYINKE